MMSQATVCRLCRDPCDDCKSLCDANGDFTEVYALTIKFFHPMFLDLEVCTRNQHTGLCMECWQHISDFNNFHRTVLLLQAKLRKDAELAKAAVQAQLELPAQEPNSSPSQDSVANVEEEFVSLSDEELRDTQRKNLLIVTECEVRFEANLDDQSETTSMRNSLKDPEHVSAKEEQNDEEEFEKPVGDFVGGEFNDDEVHYSDVSFSELEMLDDLRLTPDISTDQQMQGDSTPSTTELKKKRKTPKELDAYIAKWSPTIECQICLLKCSSFRLLQNHYRQKHPNAVCYVWCCERKFKLRSRFEEHLRLHNDPKAFGCPHCSTWFTAPRRLDIHIRRHHPTVAASSTTANCSQDKKAKYKHECDVCGKAYRVPSELREHYTLHTGETIHSCSYCERKFKYRSSLCDHLNSAHPEKIGKNRKEKVISACPHCPKTFNYRGGLHYHVKTHHPEEHAKRTTTQKYRHKCDVCGKGYRVPCELREHYTQHTGEAFHKCPHCEKKFKYRSSLPEHIRNAHPHKMGMKRKEQRVTTCSFCPRTFKHRGGVYYHIKVHHPEEYAKRTNRRTPKRND